MVILSPTDELATIVQTRFCKRTHNILSIRYIMVCALDGAGALRGVDVAGITPLLRMISPKRVMRVCLYIAHNISKSFTIDICDITRIRWIPVNLTACTMTSLVAGIGGKGLR